MSQRFANLFNLSEEQAIALLDKPLDQLGEEDSRYIAASHLVNFPTPQAIAALMRAVENTAPELDNRIVRRKSVESLGRLQAKEALHLLHHCLKDEDCYTVENAVWAIGEIGTDQPDILEDVTAVLDRPGQLYRAVIHVLGKLDYYAALDHICRFIDHEDGSIASAAIATVCRFTQDFSQMHRVEEFLQSPVVFTRRLCIQDLIDAQYYSAIPKIARCPVSLVFRLRGIRLLADTGVPAGVLTFAEIQPHLEAVIWDHPQDLDLVHAYDRPQPIAGLVRELYETDFGRAYLATQTLLEEYPEETPAALFITYEDEAYTDYGAHYHVMKLLGWLQHQPGYELLLQNLNNTAPQFLKSRSACALALAKLGDRRAIPAIQACLEARSWELRYACLMALESLGDRDSAQALLNDSDWLVQAKARSLVN